MFLTHLLIRLWDARGNVKGGVVVFAVGVEGRYDFVVEVVFPG